MLFPELIKQAEVNAKNYIEDGMLKKVSPTVLHRYLQIELIFPKLILRQK